MQFSLFLLAFTMFWKLSTSIRCFKCEPTTETKNQVTPACTHFDGSERFVVECPLSTVCFKKVTHIASLGVKTESVERGCAHQTMEGNQKKINGHWEYVTEIEDVYEESCIENSNEEDRVTNTLQCYCKDTDLCNKVGRVGSAVFMTYLVIFRLVL